MMETEKEEKKKLELENDLLEEKQIDTGLIKIVSTDEESEATVNGFQDFMNQSKGNMKRVIGCGG